MGFISLSRLQLLLGDEGYLGVIPAFEPQSEPIPPHLITPSLPLAPSLLCRPPLFTSNSPVSVSVPVARWWLLPSSLSNSSCSHCLPASATLIPPSPHPSLSLSYSLPSSLSFTPSRLLVFHSTADLGEIIAGDKFLCLPLTQRKGLQLDLLAVGSLSFQASGSSLFSLLFFHTLAAIRHLMPVMYAWQRVCVAYAVYIG